MVSGSATTSPTANYMSSLEIMARSPSAPRSHSSQHSLRVSRARTSARPRHQRHGRAYRTDSGKVGRELRAAQAAKRRTFGFRASRHGRASPPTAGTAEVSRCPSVTGPLGRSVLRVVQVHQLRLDAAAVADLMAVGAEPFPCCLKLLTVSVWLMPAHVADAALDAYLLGVLDVHRHGLVEAFGLLGVEVDT